jgi:hypothetical protein
VSRTRVCDRVSMRYIAAEDRLHVTLTSAEAAAQFFVTARFVGQLVVRWFAHDNCRVTEVRWANIAAKKRASYSGESLPCVNAELSGPQTMGQLVNTSMLKIEGSITTLGFEIGGDCFMLRMTVDESTHFLRVLRAQCSMAGWSMSHWPNWVQVAEPGTQADHGPSVH